MPLLESECEFEQRPEIRLRRSYAKGIPDFSQKLQAQKAIEAWYSRAKASLSCEVIAVHNRSWSLKSWEFPEFVHCGTEISARTKPRVTPFWIHKHDWPRATSTARARNEADKIIHRIACAAIDPDSRDEDESAPTLKVMQETARLIRGAEKLLDAMPPAQVSTFFGEINITWRAGDRIVRLAVFENRPSTIQIGSLSEPIGHYKSKENPTASLLAEKLRDFARQVNAEDSHIPWQDHAHRAIKPTWLDDQLKLKAEAFRRRPGADDEGLSVASNHDSAKTAFAKGRGVAALRIDAIEGLGLELFRDNDHGLIKGLPNADDYDLAMNMADKLVALSTFTLDPWTTKPNKP